MAQTKPTVELVKALLEKCETVYDPLWGKFANDERFHELDFLNDLRIPIEFKSQGIVLPTARDMVDTFTDQIDLYNARIRTTNLSRGRLGDASQHEYSTMMERFYYGVLYRNMVENSISPLRVGAKHYALHGLAVYQTIWDADRWLGNKDRPDAHQTIPIIIRAVNPRCIMVDPYDPAPQFVFEVQERLVHDVKERYPHWTNPENKTGDKLVKCVSWWTDTYRCELRDGEPVLKIRGGVDKHGYGFLPYTCIDSGLGNVSYDNDPCKRYVGILRYMQDLLISESRDYSIADIVLCKTAWPWGLLVGPGAHDYALSGELDQKFGSITGLPDGIEYQGQSPQVPPEALQQHLAITMGYIAAHAAPNSVRGMGEPGVRSGVDRQQLLAQASTRYRYATEAFKSGIAKVLTNCALLAKNKIPDDIEVWGQTPTGEVSVKIEKAKMRTPFFCVVDFAPIDPQDEYRRHDDIMRLTQTGIATRQWAREQTPNMDPDELEVQEVYQRLMDNPVVQQWQGQVAVAMMTQAQAKRDAAEAPVQPPMAPPMGGNPMMSGQPQPQQQGGAPRSPVTPMPNIAALGSPEDMQNKMKAGQSQVGLNPLQGFGGGGNR